MKIIKNKWQLNKRLQHQRPLSLLLSVYVGLLLNISCLLHNGSAGGWLASVTAILSAIAMVAFSYGLFSFFSFFGRYGFKFLSIFTLLISASASFYMSFYNVVIGYGVIVSTLTFDTDLTQEMIVYKFFIWLAVTGMLPSLLLWVNPIIANTKTIIENSVIEEPHKIHVFLRKALPTTITVLVLLISVNILIYLTNKQGEQTNRYMASPAGIIAHSYLPSNWIAGLAIYLHNNISEHNSAEHLFSPAEHFTYLPKNSLEDLFVVFVIGETTRWDHMGILGYARNTTPLMAQENNVVAMAGTSCDTTTKLSLRCMFVREGGTEANDQRTLKENNVFFTLRKLGFTSELFGMQSEAWFYSSTGVISYEIREELAAEFASSQRPIDDMLLVSRLEKSIKKYPQGKHLVILHTKGSHFLYSQRHTPEFAQFQPECTSVSDACGTPELINAFDNSVLYVDYMLKNVFDQLRDKNAIVFYASDHGESIEDGNHFHASPKEIAPIEQFRVPLIVWASDTFISKAENKLAFEKLQAHKNNTKIFRHEEIFDSLLGCMGYTSPDGGINPKNNWCN